MFIRIIIRINNLNLTYCEYSTKITLSKVQFDLRLIYTMLIKKLQEYMRLKNYSPRTIRTYCACAKSLYKRFRKPLNKITEQEFKDFLLNLFQKNYSSPTINQYHATLKLIFTQIYKIPFNFNIPYAKRAKKLPMVLSRQEIQKILNQITNFKHKLILSIMYAGGLRVSEIIDLKVKDVDFESKTLMIRAGKGKKDRITVLSENLIPQLKSIVNANIPENYLFPSNRGGKLTSRSVQKIFYTALKKSGVKKIASCHSLRHSFATHLLENGVNVRYIQELLGHSNLRTTQIYTKVAKHNLAKIKSPLDNL